MFHQKRGLIKMWSIVEKVKSAIWLENTGSGTQAQREFKKCFKSKHRFPDRKLIADWHRNLFETGSVDKKPRSGRPKSVVTDDNVQKVIAAFSRSPGKSTRRASTESRVWKSVLKRMAVFSSKVFGVLFLD